MINTTVIQHSSRAKCLIKNKLSFQAYDPLLILVFWLLPNRIKTQRITKLYLLFGLSLISRTSIALAGSCETNPRSVNQASALKLKHTVHTVLLKL